MYLILYQIQPGTSFRTTFLLLDIRILRYYYMPVRTQFSSYSRVEHHLHRVSGFFQRFSTVRDWNAVLGSCCTNNEWWTTLKSWEKILRENRADALWYGGFFLTNFIFLLRIIPLISGINSHLGHWYHEFVREGNIYCSNTTILGNSGTKNSSSFRTTSKRDRKNVIFEITRKKSHWMRLFSRYCHH